MVHTLAAFLMFNLTFSLYGEIRAIRGHPKDTTTPLVADNDAVIFAANGRKK